jgi:hypothetical protein
LEGVAALPVSCTEVLVEFKSPPCAAFGEKMERPNYVRFLGTLRRDCLDHMMVFSERHAERILNEYVRYYHGRPHRSLRARPPAGARWLAPARAATCRQLTAISVLGGLHHRYGFLSAGSSRPP